MNIEPIPKQTQPKIPLLSGGSVRSGCAIQVIFGGFRSEIHVFHGGTDVISVDNHN